MYKTNLLQEEKNEHEMGLKMLPSACGLGQHFQDLGHSFSPYGPPRRQITYIYFSGRVQDEP